MTSVYPGGFVGISSSAMDDAVKLMNAVTSRLNSLSAWAGRNPGMARLLTDTAAGLGGIATALGTLSTAIFLFGPALKALGIVSGGGGGAAAGVAAGGGGLGLASRAVLGTAGAVVGGAIVLGSENETPESRALLERNARQRRHTGQRLGGVAGMRWSELQLELAERSTWSLSGPGRRMATRTTCP